ncbi:MAG: leucyl aminopeptidase [Planctomycetaceae bacterium]|nr:leucyl aminopeptidase [Planctomycetaceae bacterium]
MNTISRNWASLCALIFILPMAVQCEESAKLPAETKIAGPNGLPIVVRMQGPYDADVPLQIVCYFKRTAESDTRLVGAPVELDKRLGGVVASLRARGEFHGDEFETLLIDAPAGTIKPNRLLLIGLGDEAALSLERMERVGRTALREAVKIGTTKVAFAPLIKDAGNNKLPAGEVENAVVRGMLLAYDTEKRLQIQGFAKEYTLDLWLVEAGPTYYDETIVGVKKAVEQANEAVKKRDPKSYSTKSKK